MRVGAPGRLLGFEGMEALASSTCLEEQKEGAVETQVAADKPQVQGLAGMGCSGACEEHRGGQGMGFEGSARGGSWSLDKAEPMGLGAGGAESWGGERIRSEPGH